jgi:hypothetical protein
VDFPAIPAFCFDLEEPPPETGGVSGVVSDYLDFPAFPDKWGFLLSSDDQSAYVGLGNPDGRINETVDGAGVIYELHFTSFDTVVPEPASLLLLSTGVLAVGLKRRHRLFRWKGHAR